DLDAVGDVRLLADDAVVTDDGRPAQVHVVQTAVRASIRTPSSTSAVGWMPGASASWRALTRGRSRMPASRTPPWCRWAPRPLSAANGTTPRRRDPCAGI